ncbi:MAG: hypothetical protein WCP08_09600 [Prolixibacteraceae bacterium]
MYILIMKDRLNYLLKSGKIAIVFFLFCTAIIQNTTANVKLKKEGKTITIKANLPKEIAEVQVELHSIRNRSISFYHQVSPLNPNYNQLSLEKENTDWNIFYPVVDVSLTDRMKGIAKFEKSVVSSYSVNGVSIKKIFQLNGDSINIASNLLFNWENNIYLQPADSKMMSFYLAEEIPVVDGKLNKKYNLLSEDWSGEIVIFLMPGHKEFDRITVNPENSSKTKNIFSKNKSTGLSRERLTASLLASVEFTIHCQDKSINSETRNGLNIFYDLDAKTYRRPTWIWSWGPSIKLLLECAKIPEVTKHLHADSLIRISKEIGEVSLKFQEKDTAHPAYGIITSRWTENKGTLNLNYGFEQYFSIADAQFLVGWGWIPLFKATGDRRYLDGAKLLTETTDKLTKAFDIIPMDYLNRAASWKNYSLNEQGFGPEGMNELFKVDPNPKYLAINDAYMEMLFKKFETEEGLWNRSYIIDKKETVPVEYQTRSQGWAMEGLLASYELTGKKMYLDKAEKMAEHLIKSQFEDGSWSFVFTSRDVREISDKGTPIWSYLLYKLYHYTNKEQYLTRARKALDWCLKNQYNGPDRQAYGGLVGISRASGVVYRQWFPIACTYATGFFGMAVLEELALQENKKVKKQN